MEEKRKFTIYLDQNILSHLRDGQAAREELGEKLRRLREFGADYLYSDVHVEECRAFHKPEQYVQVLDEIDGYYIVPAERLSLCCEIKPNAAKELILSETDFASRSLALFENTITMMQFVLGWLGELKASEFKRELEEDINRWVTEFECETSGLIEISSIRQRLLEPMLSLDLDRLKSESLEHQPQTERERNKWFSKIDKLALGEVADFIFSEIGHEVTQELSAMFPKNTWPEGDYLADGTLAGLSFFLFTQGVGRNPKVKCGSQSNRRKEMRAQFRDCRHIEEASRCDFFLSEDARAVKLARATYAYAGVKTEVIQILIDRSS